MADLVIFESGDDQVQVRLEGETVWLSLQQLAELFGRDKSVISRHLKNIFDTNELERESVVAKNATTAADGKTYQVEYFNLDAIISVGYRVNSTRATRFRQWATTVLRQHLVDGYSLNQQRLKERGIEFEQALDCGGSGGGDFYRTLGARTGTPFARAVLSSTQEGQIPCQDAFHMLGMCKISTFYESARELGKAT